jgi:hypothetical protein
MTHALKIDVAKEGNTRGGVVRLKRLRLRERFMRWLFGDERTITFVIPGSTVESVIIAEQEDKPHEPDAETA